LVETVTPDFDGIERLWAGAAVLEGITLTE
jgi:hypothetical protein